MQLLMQKDKTTLTIITFIGWDYLVRKIPKNQHTIYFMQKKQLASSIAHIQMLPNLKHQICKNLVRKGNGCGNMV